MTRMTFKKINWSMQDLRPVDHIPSSAGLIPVYDASSLAHLSTRRNRIVEPDYTPRIFLLDRFSVNKTHDDATKYQDQGVSAVIYCHGWYNPDGKWTLGTATGPLVRDVLADIRGEISIDAVCACNPKQEMIPKPWSTKRAPYTYVRGNGACRIVYAEKTKALLASLSPLPSEDCKEPILILKGE